MLANDQVQPSPAIKERMSMSAQTVESPPAGRRLEPLVGRRIVGISSCGVNETSQTQCEAMLFALCSDGSVWMTDNRSMGRDWSQVEEPPRGDGFSDRDRETIREALDYRKLSCGSANYQLELADLLRRI